jgi:hypothetical protein
MCCSIPLTDWLACFGHMNCFLYCETITKLLCYQGLEHDVATVPFNQFHIIYHTFSSCCVMLSRQIFLKITSFPSVRLYKSTVLQRRKWFCFSAMFHIRKQSRWNTHCCHTCHFSKSLSSSITYILTFSVSCLYQNFVCFNFPSECYIR